MKNIFFLFPGFFTCLISSAQTNTFPSSGNVGIGTTSPAYLLDVNGVGRFSGALNGTIANFSEGYNSNGSYLTQADNFAGRWKMGDGTNGNTALRFIATGPPGAIASIDAVAWDNVNVQRNLAINPNGGSVLINTNITPPSNGLMVGSNLLLNPSGILACGLGYSSNSSASYATLELYNASSGNTTLNNQVYNINLQTAGSTRLSILNNGNVGIGTTNPNRPLVLEVPPIAANTTNGILNFSDGRSADFQIDLSVGNNTGVAYGVTTLKTTSYNLALAVNNGASYVERMRITSNGNIGIGTSNPQSLLSVNGAITGKQVTVTQTGWSDFVFNKSYGLKPLSMIADYIARNNHLPDIPSAKEVEAKGLNLGKMQQKQMQKIEELTLYAIDQDKRITDQDNQLKSQQQTIEQQNKRLGQQDKLIQELEARMTTLEKSIRESLKTH